MIANPSPKQQFKTPEGCKGSWCRKCIHRTARPCQVATFNAVETSRLYDEHSRNIYKVAKRPSTRYNSL